MSVTLGVVVPCYNEQEVIRETATRMLALLERLRAAGKIGPASTLNLVDDGSRDGTWAIIDELSRTHPAIVGIKLSRNRGHQNALLAGLFTAEGDVLVSIDADLQDDINVIEQMLDEHAAGAEVVYGVRRLRTRDTWFKRTTAESFYTLMRVMGTDTVHNHADYRLLSRRAVESLKEFREVNLFLRGIVPLIGYRSCMVYYDRTERFAGESKYPLRKMVEFALDAITSFSTVPLRMITGIGIGVFLLTVAIGMWVLWIRLHGTTAVPGWASTLLPLLFLGGVQILCLGIMGEYLGKIYIESKGRPRYFIERVTPRPPSRADRT